MITTDKWHTCPKCWGIGAIRPTPDTRVQCPHCKGERWVRGQATRENDATPAQPRKK